MREFFNPWRRRLAGLALEMVCVFLCGWIRSLVIADVVYLPTNTTVVSGNGLIVVAYDGATQFSRPYWETASAKELADELREIKRYCQGIGFAVGKFNDSSDLMQVLTMPYWPLVLPLTFLSVWLLLSKTRLPTRADHE